MAALTRRLIYGLVSSLLLLACGGGGGSAPPPPPPPQPPIVSGFTPASASAGASVSIQGSRFTGASAVAFNGTQAITFSVASDTSITATVPAAATTGPISVTTPGGTGRSSTDFTVAPPVVFTAFTPANGPAATEVTLTGSGFTGAAQVRFNGIAAASFAVRSDTEITAKVPDGATTGTLSVQTPGGTATSSGTFTVTFASADQVDASIVKVLVGQATQRSDNSMRLAQDKRGYIQVSASANLGNTLKPSMKAQFFVNGTPVHEITIPAPAANPGIPTVPPAYGDFDKTYVAEVPASVFKPGLSVTATLDTGADPNPSNNTTIANLTVVDTHPFRITFVPLEITSGGTTYTAVVNPSDVGGYLEMFQRIWPVPEAIGTEIHATFKPSKVPHKDYDNRTWETTLDELAALQKVEGKTDRYYYGVYKTYYGTGGGSGMAWYGKPQAMGIDWTNMSKTFTWKAGTLAHEIGHSFNLHHSPCGGAGDPDPAYPYANGALGTCGYDVWNKKVYAPNLYSDVMGYCGYSWVSDYSVDKVMEFRLSGDSTVGSAPMVGSAPAGPKVPCLLVWGLVVNGEVRMNPSFALDAVPDPEPLEATYQVEVTSETGLVLGNARFEPHAAAHGTPGVKGFVLTVPIKPGLAGPGRTEPVPAHPAGVRVLRHGEVLGTLKGRSVPEAAMRAPAGSAPRAAARRVDANRVHLSWDAQAHPMALVKNAKGEVIAFAENGEVTLSTQDALLEVHLSEGPRSVPVKVVVEQGL